MRTRLVSILAVCLLLGSTATVVAQAPDVDQLLADNQELIDFEMSRIDGLQKQLDEATRKGDQNRADELRVDIQSGWDRVQQLKETRKFLEASKPGGAAQGPVRGGNRPFGDKATLPPPKPQRAMGAMTDDGRDASEAEPTDMSPKQRPQRGGGGGDAAPPADEKAPQPGARGNRPQRGGAPGGANNDPEVAPAPRKTIEKKIADSEKLIEDLRARYLQLIESGEIDKAALVMQLIRDEKARVQQWKDELAAGPPQRADVRPQPPAGGDPKAPGAERPGNPAANNGPANPDDIRDKLEAMQEEIERLREELKKYKEGSGETSDRGDQR